MKELLENLDYDPTTGIFEWCEIPMGQTRKRAGYQDKFGYRHIRLNRKLYKEHRLAWLVVHGEMPPQEVDHINGDPSDNRIANLRLATSAQNKCNARLRCDSSSGFKGVSFHKQSGKWRATIQLEHIGSFESRDDAHRAYCDEGRKRFGEFFNSGRKSA